MCVIYKIKPNKLPPSASRGLLLAIDLGVIHFGPIECIISVTDSSVRQSMSTYTASLHRS